MMLKVRKLLSMLLVVCFMSGLLPAGMDKVLAAPGNSGAYGYVDNTSLNGINASEGKEARLSEEVPSEEAYNINEGGGEGSGGSTTKTVTGIEIVKQPKLVYVEGEQLDLMPLYDGDLNLIYDGLSVILHYSDGSTLGPMDYSDFEMRGTTDPV